jgi:hypothetical protein
MVHGANARIGHIEKMFSEGAVTSVAAFFVAR